MIRTLFALLFMAATALAQTDALDSALTLIGETRAGFKVDIDVLKARASAGRFKLDIFDQWFEQPLRIPFYERHLRNSLLDSEGRLHPLFGTSSGAIGMGTRRDLIPPTPLEKYAEQAARPGALMAAILALDSSALVPKILLPPQAERDAAILLFAIQDGLTWREMAMRNVPVEERSELYRSLIEPLEHSVSDTLTPSGPAFPADYRKFYEQIDLMEKLDLTLLSAAADDITAVVDSVCRDLRENPSADTFSFRCSTRYGDILISAGSDDNYTAMTAHSLLILDLSGNDHYGTGGASDGADYPIGIIIDGAGNDTYRTSNTSPVFGAGILGIGILADAAGDDVYESPGYYSQGSGLGGIGLLWDSGGNDSYSALGGAQGFGFFGFGILSDQAGDDHYHAYNNSQACGMTRGFGVLLDLAGNDVYEADDTDIQFPSPQSKDHNASMCQGAGYGIRRDYVDGHSLAGGVGLLLDGAGDDSYSGGVFSQAVGYWFGIGILDDRAGNDRYRDVWYGQSATAHFGISFLDEGGGDDTYSSLMTMSTGAAHDFSVSLFMEESGNDNYELAANALGRSLNSSAALFVDKTGDDSYSARDAFGESANFSKTGLRAETKTIAAFLDLDGQDSYPENIPGNNHHWQQTSSDPLPILRGAGLDGNRLEFGWQ